jgi:predicted transcriptional regulator
VAKKSYRKRTAEQRAAQLERRRFIEDVVQQAAVKAGIDPSPAGRRAHIDRVIADLMTKKQAS